MSEPKPLLTPEQIEQFNRDGFIIIRGFYDLKSQIEPIQRDIHKIIGIQIKKHGLAIAQSPFEPETFDMGYQKLIEHDRKIGSVVYNAIKQIPAFIRLVGEERHARLVTSIRGTDLPGIAAGGYGIRIDNPFEEKFRSNWHQDYPYQLRSLDGLVFWSSLVTLTEDLGPLQIAVGSHKDGIHPLTDHDPEHPEKTLAYGYRLYNEAELLRSFPHIEALVSPGDLLIIDFLNLHGSGFNKGSRSRWSMQIRYFNFREEEGQKLDWIGSFAAGESIRDIYPNLIVD